MSPEAWLLWVSTKNHDLLEGLALEFCKSRTSQTSHHSAHAEIDFDKSDWLRIRNQFSALAQKIGLSQRLWFLKETRMENILHHKAACRHSFCMHNRKFVRIYTEHKGKDVSVSNLHDQLLIFNPSCIIDLTMELF